MMDFFENESFMSIITCWPLSEKVKLIQKFNGIGIRVSGQLPPWGISSSGVLLDMACPQMDDILQIASEEHLFNIQTKWLIMDSSLSFDSGESSNIKQDEREQCYNKTIQISSRLEKYYILPDSQVNIAVECEKNVLKIMEVYKPGMSHEMIVDERGSGRRYDLRGIELKAGTIVLHPECYDGLNTFDGMALPHVDTYPKIHYPLVKNMEKQLNFKLDLQVLNDYGWKNNDSTFSGLMGLMQSRSIDFSATGLFLRHDRLEVMDSTAETFSLRSAILYRQPPLSSLKNIFVLPFSIQVWIGCALLYLLITLFLQFEFKLNSVSSWKSPLEIITIVLGSICQQSSYIWPESSSSKITIFLISVTSLFFYTSYSATIVAILQTPSTEIQTLSDLTRSPLKVGVQDLTYNRVNFKETFDRDVRSLYETKILSKKHNAYCSPSEGIRSVRKGFFAFQVEVDQGYKLISDTFEESEKCGLSEMTLFPMPVLVLTVTKRSGYRELFTRQLRWQREVGIMNRIAGRWLPQKPSCSSRGGGDYVRVGMSELLPAWRILSAGMLLAAAIFTLELIYNRRIAKIKLFSIRKAGIVERHSTRTVPRRKVEFNVGESLNQGIRKPKDI
ncbi:hypothetical protein LSTR_LSTR003625 [Laodelphax striatellus]|uniref:Ionotropic glutamate receptor C-terminal domain-containing protein n=1 Tax=Laodelphax striatellus TaxID=195883 RepID=A0A482XB44_LAOST|nr:hypothetical protein LSTR_LSTR003625 [Laodelphax striatellus]